MTLGKAISVGIALGLLGCHPRNPTIEDTNASDTETYVRPDSDRDGWSVEEGDCDDRIPEIHPAAGEQCNRIDDDCDGLVDGEDPDLPVGTLSDDDGDGYQGSLTQACGDDCDDGDASIHPGAADAFCDGIDSDCDSGGIEIAAVATVTVGTLSEAFAVAGPDDEILVCPGAHVVGLVEVSSFDGRIGPYSGSPEDTALVSGVLSGTGTLALRDLTLEAFHLRWTGPLDIERSRFIASAVDVEYSGTASAEPGVVVRNSTFRDVTYSTDGSPVAARVIDGSLVVEGCEFHGNQAARGAIELALSDGTALVSATVFEENSNAGSGGAIGVHAEDGDSALRITTSTFDGNSAQYGGGALDASVWDGATLAVSIDSSTFTENVDGAVLAVASGVSTLAVDIHDTTFATNGTNGAASSPAAALAILGRDDANLTVDIVRTQFSANTSSAMLAGGCSDIVVEAVGGLVRFEDTTIQASAAWNEDGNGCSARFSGADTAISWSGGSVLQNEQFYFYVNTDPEEPPFSEWRHGGYGALYLGLEAGNAVSFDNVAFGTEADANQPRDIYECSSNPHVGTITADLDAANPCP
jgi:hypothetical protein